MDPLRFSLLVFIKNKMPLGSTRIGIIGGGQLGQMLAQAAVSFGHYCNVLDMDIDCPAGLLANEFIQGDLQDPAAISKLASVSDILTYEIEHINTQVLLELEKSGKEIIPSPKVLAIIQDKGRQKQFMKDNDIPTSPFCFADNISELNKASSALKQFARHVAKSCTGGYDGRGVFIFEGEVQTCPIDFPVVVEGFIQCKKELAVMVARDRQGNTKAYPAVEMVFNPQANLVDYLLCPADLPKSVEENARRISEEAVMRLNGVGVFAVELFLDAENRVYINEIAPRPHNSGHHTIEACATSQYEQLLRILLRLPLGSTTLIKPAVMFNILGPEGIFGRYELHEPERMLAVDEAFLHLYGKVDTKPHRKLGHVTILGDTREEALSKMAVVRANTNITAKMKKTPA